MGEFFFCSKEIKGSSYSYWKTHLELNKVRADATVIRAVIKGQDFSKLL